jgi:hypothetical protein
LYLFFFCLSLQKLSHFSLFKISFHFHFGCFGVNLRISNQSINYEFCLYYYSVLLIAYNIIKSNILRNWVEIVGGPSFSFLLFFNFIKNHNHEALSFMNEVMRGGYGSLLSFFPACQVSEKIFNESSKSTKNALIE